MGEKKTLKLHSSRSFLAGVFQKATAMSVRSRPAANGRSLAEPKDVATFFAGRGKKNHDDQLHSGAKALNSCMNGRGKKGSNNELDMFVAGRGK